MSTRTLYDWLISIKPDDLSEHAWAMRAKVSRSWFGDVRKGSAPRSSTLERVLAAIDYTVAQFEDLRGRASQPTRAAVLPFRAAGETMDVPLMGTAQASDMEVKDNGEVAFVEQMDLNMSETIDHLRRPGTLAARRDVYALTVVGSSATPKYDEGDPIYVDPKRQPVIGDYVVLQLKRADAEGREERLHIALLKELVRRTSSYIELRQLNPKVTFRVPTTDVHAVHRVIPWREIVYF